MSNNYHIKLQAVYSLDFFIGSCCLFVKYFDLTAVSSGGEKGGKCWLPARLSLSSLLPGIDHLSPRPPSRQMGGALGAAWQEATAAGEKGNRKSEGGAEEPVNLWGRRVHRGNRVMARAFK